MLFDIHLHTDISACGHMSIHDAIATAGRRGLDGICITDHGTMAVLDEIDEGFQDNGLLLIVGMEYRTLEGEFLIFGPYRDIEPWMASVELLQMVEETGGAAIAAHPRRLGADLPNSIFRDGFCKVVETHNGRNVSWDNDAAIKLANRYDLCGVAGSDAHCLEEIGRFPTRFSVPVKDRADFIAAIKGCHCEPAWTEPRTWDDELDIRKGVEESRP